jgi:Ca2+-binding RTX toxin-like protein
MAYPVKVNGIWTLNGVQLLGYTVTGTSGSDTIQLSDWFGTPALTGGIMYSDGGAGNDTITGSAYRDVMYGGAGNDILNGGGGTAADSIYGGDGNDTITSSSGGANDLHGDAGIDIITGGTGMDFIYGGTEGDILDGSLGNDYLYGEAGDDTLTGGRGRDHLDGGAGDDIFKLRGDGWLQPAYDQPGGYTTFYADTGWNNSGDYYQGGTGLDTLQAAENNLTLVLDDATSLSRDSIEALSGTGFQNFRVVVTGSGPQDFTRIRLDNVTLDFSNGDDVITGSSFNQQYDSNNDGVINGLDVTNGASGNDRIDGGFGVDTVNFNGNYNGGYTVTVAGVDNLGRTHFRVLDTNATDGNTGDDDLVNVERIHFADRTLDLTPTNWQDTDATGGNAVDGVAGTVSENANNGASVGIDLSVQASADLLALMPGATVSYSLLDSVGGTFAIDPVTGIVTVANASLLDYETAPVLPNGTDHGYTITVQATTGGVNSTHTFTILVADGNDRPVGVADADAAAADYVDEGAATGTYTGVQAQGTDPNGDAMTYTLSDNAGGRFSINAADGRIYVANGALLDFEGQAAWNVTVRVTDSFGAWTDQVFAINLNDVTGDTPSDSDTATYDAVDENAATGTYTGVTASAVSPSGSAMTYALTDNAGGRFQIDGATGRITVLDGTLLDYEAQNYWSITVRATDAAGIASSQVFTIYLNDQASETWNGTAGADTFTLTRLGDWTLDGQGGNDVLVGSSSSNVTFIGGDGNDTLIGLAGNDTFLYAGTTGGMDVVDGGAGYDVVRATADNTVIGLSSINNIEEISSGGFANVTLQLGIGNDVIDANVVTLNGISTIRTGAGNDTIIGTTGNDVILGEDGDDLIRGGYGTDNLNGGNGTDTLSYQGSYAAVNVNLATNVVSGGDADGDVVIGFENVVGSDYNDTLTGSTGNNVLTGGAGDDIMDGGAGNDTFNISVNSGIDAITGGTGTDTIRFVEDNATLSLSAIATVEVIDATGINNAQIAGTAGANTLNFSAVTLTNIAGIYGLEGNDAITGSAGNDIIIGGAGDDTLSGGNGNDTFRYLGGDEGFDALNGGGGTDTIEALAYGATIGISSITAIEAINGAGDTVIMGSTAANTLNFSTTTLSGIAMIDGGAGNDVITGSAGNDIIRGGAGNDTLNGGDGNDTFYVNGTAEGSDVYAGGNGYDQILAQGDNTTIGLGTTISGIELISSQGYLNTKIAGTTGIDTWDFSTTTLSGITSIASGAGNDIVTGSAGDDVIIGGAGADTLNGGAGIDTLSYAGSTVAVTIDLGANTATGGDATGDIISNFENIAGSSAADTLTGNAGNNIIWGGAGNDRITGASGFDTLYGEAGNDIFDFNAVGESAVGSWSDIIADFVKGQDKIDVTTIDSNTVLAGDQNFSFLGTAAFSGVAGQLRYDNSIGDGFTHVFGDINGDRIADFEIRMTGTYTLASTDFIL